VFKLATNGLLSSLMSFDSTNGAQPHVGLSQGSDGQFYGTAAFGGTNGRGAAFRISTNSAFSSFFSYDTSGYTPYGGVVQGTNGKLYGTTYQGGTYSNGIVYQLTTNGGFTVVYSFKGSNDGANSYAGLIQGTDGNFYGTTFYGGSNGFGAVFKLTPNGTFSLVHSFDGTNGAYPQAPLLQATDGNFYGTTQNGGPYTNQLVTAGYGTVFRLGMDGTFTSLFSFNGTNGGYPRAGLIQGADGSFYGTTTYGGTSDSGTVFRLTLSAPSAPVFQGIVLVGGAVVLTWSAAVGQQYQMMSRTNLELANWANLGGVVTATNAVMTTLDNTGLRPAKYYRIQVLTGP
jgi:uncharacterized repeat protein (TIGR03803 family)